MQSVDNKLQAHDNQYTYKFNDEACPRICPQKFVSDSPELAQLVFNMGNAARAYPNAQRHIGRALRIYERTLAAWIK